MPTATRSSLTSHLGQANLALAMTIHVNIGEAKTRLSELLSAMKRGERVVIMRAGEPEAEIVPAREVQQTSREERGRKRRAAFGMFKKEFEGFDTSLEVLKAERGDPDLERTAIREDLRRAGFVLARRCGAGRQQESKRKHARAK